MFLWFIYELFIFKCKFLLCFVKFEIVFKWYFLVVFFVIMNVYVFVKLYELKNVWLNFFLNFCCVVIIVFLGFLIGVFFKVFVKFVLLYLIFDILVLLLIKVLCWIVFDFKLFINVGFILLCVLCFINNCNICEIICDLFVDNVVILILFFVFLLFSLGKLYLDNMISDKISMISIYLIFFIILVF